MESEKIAINSCTQKDLLKIRGVGPKLAKKIRAYKKANGPFRTPTDLAKVPGISLDFATQIAPQINWDIKGTAKKKSVHAKGVR